jgi:unsaturated rhamnogalacturonyl hydrolase
MRENNRRRDGTYEYYISEPIVENDAKGLAPFLLCYTELLLSNYKEEQSYE